MQAQSALRAGALGFAALASLVTGCATAPSGAYWTMYALRTSFVWLRLVACGVSDVNTTMLPARTGTSTAVG